MTDYGFTAGDLAPLITASESIYATTPSAGWNYGIESTKVKRKDALNQFEGWWGGSRSMNMAAYVTQRIDAAFSVTGNTHADRAGDILAYACGLSTGTTEIQPLPSFSAIADVAGNRWLYNGCKVDSCKVSFEDAKSVAVYEAEVLASDVELLSGWTSARQTVTVVPPSSRSAREASQVLSVTLDGDAIYPLNGSISISNGLVRERGSIRSRPATVGLGAGRRSIIFECDLWLKDLTYLNKELLGSAINALTVTLGDSMVTLADGRFKTDGSAWPDLVNDLMKQHIVGTFAEVSIA